MRIILMFCSIVLFGGGCEQARKNHNKHKQRVKTQISKPKTINRVIGQVYETWYRDNNVEYYTSVYVLTKNNNRKLYHNITGVPGGKIATGDVWLILNGRFVELISDDYDRTKLYGPEFKAHIKKVEELIEEYAKNPNEDLKKRLNNYVIDNGMKNEWIQILNKDKRKLAIELLNIENMVNKNIEDSMLPIEIENKYRRLKK